MTRCTIGLLITLALALLVTPPETCSSRKESGMRESTFDAQAYKAEQRHEWGQSATGWKHHWETWERGAQHVNDRLVELAAIQPGHQVLDIASGLGEPALTAARQVGPAGKVVGTDIAPEMLAMARAAAEALGLRNIEFRDMDAEAPDLPAHAFHAILCRFGLMFLPNLSTALTQLHQLLMPGGRLAAAVWGPPAHAPAISLPLRIVRQRRHLPPPPAGVPGAFSLADEPRLHEYFQQAGFTQRPTEHVTVTLEYSSPEMFIEERLATSVNTRLLLAEASEAERADIFGAIKEELQTYREADGLIRLRNDVLCIVGW
jgi:SAM-dependent methyltransferase